MSEQLLVQKYTPAQLAFFQIENEQFKENLLKTGSFFNGILKAEYRRRVEGSIQATGVQNHQAIKDALWRAHNKAYEEFEYAQARRIPGYFLG